MQFAYLSESVEIKTVSEDKYRGVFEVLGLYAGYGLTVGNALRRTLLSSLPGAAVTQIKIKNVPHEFSTLPGIAEDVVELILNFKKLRFIAHAEEPQVLTIKVKGEGVVHGKDIKETSDIQVINKDIVLATLTAKNAEFDVEIVVERGLGYSTVESRKQDKLGIGVIPIDAFFSPVTKVNYSVHDMRVGERTNYNRLVLEIETDGTLSPSSALHKSTSILKDHFEKISLLQVQSFEDEVAEMSEASPRKRKVAKKKEDETES